MESNKIRLSLIFLLIFSSIGSRAEKSKSELIKAIVSAGFENVRVVEKNQITYISLEDNQYVWNIDGILTAVNIIGSFSIQDTVSLVMLNHSTPFILIDLEYIFLEKEGKVKPNIRRVTYDFEQSWKVLKDEAPGNSPVRKADLVVYPQFSFKNANFDQLYHVQFNIAPAIETSLWRGNLLTGQLIFPVVNSLNQEDNFIRPGFLTLAQQFNLPHRWFGLVTTGNFNSSRWGADINLWHPFGDSNWSMKAMGGLTGLSQYQNGKLIAGKLNTFSGSVSVSFYCPKFCLQSDLAYGRFLSGDQGFRLDCSRHFGPTTIGFYACYGDGPVNGGFHFSTPLFAHKHQRRNKVRIRPSNYFDMEYNAGTESTYFQYFETRPNQNRSEYWTNPRFIKDELNRQLLR